MKDYSILDLQNKILEIAVYLDNFCREHGIVYYLMGGSALGAIRHQGFIPWDDDFDVFMTYDNYKRFLEACEKDLDKEHFYLQKENTPEWPLYFSKLRMNNTTFIEEDTKDRKMHKGIYVDIMCLNNTSKNKIYRYLQYLSARLLIAKTLALRGYNTTSVLKKVAMGIAKVFVRGPVERFLLGIVRGLNTRDTEYVGHFFGRAKFKHTSFPREYLGTPRYVKFSTAYLPVPEKVEKYLELRYGKDFMAIPDQKTRDRYPVHALFFDPNKNYTEYE